MEKNEETKRYELKEKVSFGYVLMDRLLSINWSFDSQDKIRLHEGLTSLYDNLTPYLTDEQKQPIDEKLKKLKERFEGSDRSKFFDEAHQVFRILLVTMRDLKLLTKEVRIDTY